MRNEPIEPEKRLWRNISNSQLGGFKFCQQTIIGTYICDFSCLYNGLVIEIDDHTHDEDSDEVRDQMLMRMGYHVLRFSNVDVMQNMQGVLERILTVAQKLPERRYTPTPTPPLEGRGFKE